MSGQDTVCDVDCYFISKDFVEDDSESEDNIKNIPEEIMQKEFDNLKSNQEISDNECKPCSFVAKKTKLA